MTALDADKDGEISAEELEGAVKALKGLDKDGDGKLSRTELMGERPSFGGFGGRPGGAPGGAPGGTPGGPGGGTEGFVSRLMQNDKDGDGKLTKEELPERAQGLLERGDANKDGSLDKEEITKVFASFGQRRPGQGGPGGRPGGRPQGDRPPGEGGGDRPQRPAPDSE
jgi:Ca2+-binding EF-hand superfamily protein